MNTNSNPAVTLTKSRKSAFYCLTVLFLMALCANTARAQGALTNGWTHTGTIAPVADSDTWTFAATAGDSIVIRVGEITQTNNFTPRIRLQNPNAVQIGSVSGSVAAEIAVTATNTGTFTLIVDDAVGTTATGTYRLTLAKSPGTVFVAPGDEGGPMTNGVAHQAYLPPGDADVWTFTATNGDAIVVKIGQTSDTNAFDPWVRLYGPDGVLLGSEFGAAAAEVSLRATNAGAFLIVIANNPYNNVAGSGTYLLTLGKTGSAIVVSPGDEGGPMTNGAAHTGGMTIGDLDLWSFTATNGNAIVVKVGQTSDTNAFDPWVRLYGPDGALLGSEFGAAAAEVSLRATNAGTFLVVIANNPYNNEAGSGTYLLTLAKTGGPIVVSTGDEGGPMTNGAAHTGSMPIGDLDLWSFTANSGESIVVKVGQASETNNFAPWVRLYGPDGVLVASSWAASSAELAITATNSGSFLVVIGNNPYYNDAASGTYLLTLAKPGTAFVVSPGDEGGPMTNGLAHTGSMPIGDLDLWSLAANSGDSIVIRAGQASETNNFAPWVRLYGPNGALLGSDFDLAAGELSLRATNSGTFLVVIGNNPYYNDGASGTYGLTLAKTGSANVVSPGDEGGPFTGSGVYTGSIPVGDLDLWTFTICAGQLIDVRADQLSETNSFAPLVRLYGPNGVLVGTNFGISTAEVIMTATNSGLFLVVIANSDYYDNAGSGTYQLTVNGLSDGFKLCVPAITGTNTTLSGIGGPSNATYVLFTHTNVTTPVASWTPIRTNQFDPYGVFYHTNPFNPTEPQRYFRLRTP